MSGPGPGPVFPAESNEPAREWKCSNCRQVLGIGPQPPKLEKCPKCGAKLTTPFNYYVVGGLGGAVVAGLIWFNVLRRWAQARAS